MRSSHSLRDYIGRWLVIGGLPRTYRAGLGLKMEKHLPVREAVDVAVVAWL